MCDPCAFPLKKGLLEHGWNMDHTWIEHGWQVYVLCGLGSDQASTMLHPCLFSPKEAILKHGRSMVEGWIALGLLFACPSLVLRLCQPPFPYSRQTPLLATRSTTSHGKIEFVNEIPRIFVFLYLHLQCSGGQDQRVCETLFQTNKRP
jgi:hypothetical protein